MHGHTRSMPLFPGARSRTSPRPTSRRDELGPERRVVALRVVLAEVDGQVGDAFGMDLVEGERGWAESVSGSLQDELRRVGDRATHALRQEEASLAGVSAVPPCLYSVYQVCCLSRVQPRRLTYLLPCGL